MTLYLLYMETSRLNTQNIWEENDSTEAKMNYSNNNVVELNDITNDIKTDSTSTQCNDIGERKKQWKRLYYLRHKDSILVKNKEYQTKNKEKYRGYKKKWELENKEPAKLRRKDWENRNQEKIKIKRLKNKDKNKEYMKKYYEKNKYKLNPKQVAYFRNRRNTNIQCKLSVNLRKRLYMALKTNCKRGSAVKNLGCSIEYFKQFIESKFQSGMTWNNYGQRGWHLDHIKPLSLFNLEDKSQFLEACNYTNYQPLWATDNIKKGNRII